MLPPEDVPTPHLVGTDVALASVPASFVPDESFSQRDLLRAGKSVMGASADRARRFRAPKTASLRGTGGPSGLNPPHPTTQVLGSRRLLATNLPLGAMVQERRSVAPPAPDHHFWGSSTRERKVMDRRSRARAGAAAPSELAEEEDTEVSLQTLRDLRANFEKGSPAVPPETVVVPPTTSAGDISITGATARTASRQWVPTWFIAVVGGLVLVGLVLTFMRSSGPSGRVAFGAGNRRRSHVAAR